MTTLDVSTLQTFKRLYPIFIEKYETLLPTADTDVTVKLNSMIDYLNKIGHLTNDVVKNWNMVMEWVINDGLTQTVSDKIDKMFTDGNFNELIDAYSVQITNEFNTKLTQTNTDISTAQQTAQTQIDLINQNLVARQSDLELTNSQLAQKVSSTNIKNVRDNTNIFEYSTDGLTWKQVQGGSSLQAYLINTYKTTADSFYVSAVIDMSGKGFTATDKFAVSFDYYTEDANLTNMTVSIYCNSVSDINNFSGGTSVTDTAVTLVKNTTTPYSKSNWGAFNSNYTYAHVLINLGTVQRIPSLLNLKNFKFTVGTTEITPLTIGLMSSGLWSGSKFIPITSTWDSLINRNNFNGMLGFPSYLSKWFNKNSIHLGDSITAGYNATTPYPTLLKSILGLNSITNSGISGSCISGTDQYSTNVYYATRASGYDLVTVLGGVNDFVQGVPIGSFGDTTNATFYGALKILIEGLINKYPTSTIMFMTPLHKSSNSSSGDIVTGENNETSGVTLKQYVDAVKDMCSRYGVPCLDLYSMSGLYPALNAATYMTDGIHPNDAGHVLLARRIAPFIMQL